jgi:hypothetical protein
VGDKVRFRLADVFLPSPGAALPIAEEEAELEGTIIDFSDSGQKPHYFAVVEVVLTQSLIVPVAKLDMNMPSKRESDA